MTIESRTTSISDRTLSRLVERGVGVRLYSDALRSPFAPARFRDFWRVLESAFNRRDNALVEALSDYQPAKQLGFEKEELRALLVLRGRASHAATQPEKSLDEAINIVRECNEALPRLMKLAERVVLTKKSWGYRTAAVDEILPLRSFPNRAGGTTIIMPPQPES
jgi:hypothetical protein